MGCTLGAIITAGLTWWLGWPVGTIIGVALYAAIAWALWKQGQEERQLQNAASRKIVDG